MQKSALQRLGYSHDTIFTTLPAGPVGMRYGQP